MVIVFYDPLFSVMLDLDSFSEDVNQMNITAWTESRVEKSGTCSTQVYKM